MFLLSIKKMRKITMGEVIPEMPYCCQVVLFDGVFFRRKAEIIYQKLSYNAHSFREELFQDKNANNKDN